MADAVTIGTVVAVDDDGADITVAGQIVRRVRATGAPLGLAAVASGVDKDRALAWRRRGARARTAEKAGTVMADVDVPYAEFAAGLERAEAEIELALLGAIAREAVGGFPLGKTVEVVREGTTVSKTTTSETARPVWQAGAYLRAHAPDPDPPSALELLNADGDTILIPPAQRAAQLAAWLRPPPLELGPAPDDD